MTTMLIESDYKVWVSVGQRLDGLTGRWGPDPYVGVTISPGKDKGNIEFNLDLGIAKMLARGLNKAVKRAAA